jgi:hypothetical protein
MSDVSAPVDPAASPRQGRGLCLLSGGLDSQLTICVLRDQGLHVEAVVFASPFFKIEAAKRAAEKLNVALHIVSFTQDILGLVSHPPHGFGGGLNPCIDCHARMIRRAGELMAEKGFDFVATGEVLNQRPMSQNRRSLGIVEQDSALNGRLLRPLSALLLEPTVPELEGVVDRTRLLGLNGRSRKPQMELARQFGLVEYPSPAGGCLLTEKGFCRKLADMKANEGLGDERLRAQRPQQAAVQRRVLLHNAQRPAVLRHGPLVEHLARRHEVEALLRHQLARAPDHPRVAVDAGIQPAAEPVRRMAHQPQDVLRKGDNVQGDVQLLCRPLGRLDLEERAGEHHRLDVQPLIAQHADRQLAVEPAREQAQASSLPRGGRRINRCADITHGPAVR